MNGEEIIVEEILNYMKMTIMLWFKRNKIDAREYKRKTRA